MSKGLKISIISLSFIASFLVMNSLKAADCSICKFDSGACTIDLRPGQGDGTLCGGCTNSDKCVKSEDSKTPNNCFCKPQPKPENVVGATTNNVVTNNNNKTTNSNQLPNKVNGGAQANNTVTIVLIIVGTVVLAGGIFVVIKFMQMKKD
jgi:hypothetical protein